MLLVLGDGWFEDQHRSLYRLIDMQEGVSGSVMAQVLTIGKPGYLMDGLRSMIKSMQGMALLETAHTLEEGWSVCCASRPEIAVIDMTTAAFNGAGRFDFKPQAVFDFIRRCKREYPQISLLLIAEHQADCRKGADAGADRAVLQGFDTAQLHRVLRYLILQQQSGAL